MTRFRIVLSAATLIALTASLAAVASNHRMMSVQVRRGDLRAQPTFLSKIVSRIPYGNRVAVLEEKGSWKKVTPVGHTREGWIHSSALTSKKIVLTAGDADVKLAATSDEIALAGKGFNKQVEDAFKTQNPNADFSWIDRMERMTVSQTQIQNFLREGDLVPQGGAQ